MDGTDKLQALRPRYLERLEARITLLEELAGEPEAQREIHRIAHSMGSSAMIYGYPALSAAARKLEALFRAEIVGAAALDRHLRELIAAARSVAENPAR